MAIAVLDIEFEQLPAEISDLAQYSQALVVVRLKGVPIGQVRLPVFGGRIGGAELRAAILEAAGWSFWKQWLRHYLEWDERDELRPSLPAVSVAVCTRDRPDDLGRCLEALLRLPDDGQEIMVVDNCPSTDATRRLVEQYGRVRYIREERPGLNNARNRALAEARHEVVAFTDDDAAPDPGWLRALRRNYGHPLTLCVTGLTLPKELETEAQVWFERAMPFGRGFEQQVFEKSFVNPLAGGRSGAGVNMSFRREVMACVGGFDPALDAGTASQAGGDNEMFSRILAAGYRIVYEPRALVWHRHRRSWPELQKQIYGYGIAKSATLARHVLIDRELDAVNQARLWLQRRLKQLIRSWLGRPGSLPAGLNLALLAGFAVGPFAYLSARRCGQEGYSNE
jgi:glycosyltransferase involved in cell wall biosynthesis